MPPLSTVGIPTLPRYAGSRPAELEGGKAIKVYLDAQSIAIAQRLGNGNTSEGIRKALKQAEFR